MDAFFAVIDDDRDRAIFRVAYHRGLRASEIGLWQLSDYRQEAGKLFVRRLKGSNSGDFNGEGGLEERFAVGREKNFRKIMAIGSDGPWKRSSTDRRLPS